MDTWMIAGPFDLSAATEAALTFDLWIEAEVYEGSWADALFVGASSDGEWFDGVEYGGSSNGWVTESIDLTDYLGQPSVWVGFEFYSDDMIALEGAYVDNVQLTCTTGNRRPAAVPDVFWLVANNTVEWSAPGVLRNDVDPDGDALAAFLLSNPGHGTLLLRPDGSLSYTPTPYWYGTDEFTYRAFDGAAYSSETKVSIIVEPGPAQGVDDEFWTPPGQTLVVSAPGVLRNDVFPRNTAVITDRPSGGSAILNPNGSFTYTPNPGFQGDDWFGYMIEAGASSGWARVRVRVMPAQPILVYRFFNRRAGTHFYTTDPAERDRVRTTLAHIYTFEGLAYQLNGVCNEWPLMRFYCPRTGTHFYSADPNEVARLYSMRDTYTYEGLAYMVSTSPSSSLKPAVHRFYNTKNGTHFYSADPAEVANVRTNLSNVYSYDGIAFYLGQ